jgi:hypothetical protein
MERKRSGWRTAGLIAGVGCLSMIALVIGGVAIAWMMARSTLNNLGDPDPKPVDRRIVLPAAPQAAAERDTSTADSSAPLRLTLDLREGTFTIRPGEPGSDIHVSGEYAPGLFELVETQDVDAASGVRRATVRFHSKAPAWARFFGGMGNDAGQPELTITIPRGMPIELTLETAMGRSEVDLGGLTLREVTVNATMGEHSINFEEPVVEAMRDLRIHTSMGNVVLENLGNARAVNVTSSSSMGNVTASLGGAWQPGAETNLTFEQSMGELTVRVPSSVRLDSEVRNQQDQTTKRDADAAPADPKAPNVRLRVTSSMGNARVVRY